MEFRSILHEKAQSGKKFRLEDLCIRTTFDVISKATFGQSLNAKKEGSPAMDQWEAMSRAFASTRVSNNPIKNFFAMRTVKAERAKLDEIMREMVRERFDAVIREKRDLRNKKGLGLMDLILRDHVDESHYAGQDGINPAFLEVAITQVKTLMVAGAGTTSDAICFTFMLYVQRISHNR